MMLCVTCATAAGCTTVIPLCLSECHVSMMLCVTCATA